MSAAQFFVPGNHATVRGLAAPGATASLYTTGTLTPQPFYSDSALSVSLGTTITANGVGNFPIAYQDPSIPFRLILKDKNGAELDGGDIDPYNFGYSDRVRITPESFGATRYNPSNEVDATAALQAFFDHAATPQNARNYVYDWSGEWMVRNTIYAAYWDSGEPNVERRFICGTLRVDVLANLPSASPLGYVMEIAGYRQNWQGLLAVHEASATSQYQNTTYATRRFTRGVHIRAFANSTIGDIAVDGARRDAVHFEGWEAGFTVNGITFSNANSIGAKLGRINGRLCGSSYLFASNQAPSAITASARTQGCNTGTAWTAEVFNTTTAGHENNDDQRTKITCSSTSEIEVNDLVWGRVELTATIYGTIAADSGTSTVTWSAGDPTNLDGSSNGLVVGDIYPIFQGGENVGKRFRIVSFGGTSNRTITLTRADPDTTDAVVTHAATASATYVQYGQKSWHWVSQVIDSTHFTVTPWVPGQVNSTFRVVTGAAFKCEGDDTANVNVAGVIGLNCGTGWYSKGNYAPTVDTVLAESCGVALRVGDPNYATFGLEIKHGHAEACDADLISGHYNNGAKINMASLFDLKKVVASGPRGGLNEMNASTPRTIGSSFQLFYHGALLDMPIGGPNETTSGNSLVTNSTRYRQHFTHTDSPSLTIGYDFDEARHFIKHHWAEATWTDDDGSDPDGTGTFTLDAPLIALGWVFAGYATGTSFTIVNPTSNVRLLFQFLLATKKVAVSRVPVFDNGGSLTGPAAITSSSATAGVGYSTGAGGTVTQATSRTTGVTLNTICGAITLVSAAGSASWQTFTVTNSTVAATDVIRVSQKSGTDLNMIHVTNVAAGSFKISFATTGGTTTEQPVFNFAVVKAVTS